jgi:tetratricopeptide (TPR) repeat protein
MRRARALYKAFLPAVAISLFCSLPAVADDFGQANSLSTKQLPAWAEDGWSEYKAKRAAGQLKEAEAVLNRVQNQASSVGIQRFDLPAAVLVQEGEEDLSHGNIDEAVESGQAALQWSPDDPNSAFFLARALYARDSLKPSSSIAAYFNAISTGFRDFWFSFYMIGALLLVLFVGLLGSFLVLCTLLLVRYVPLLVHSLHELSTNMLIKPAVWTLVISLLLAPLFIGLSVGFGILWALCLVWLYMTRGERIVVAGMVVVFSLASFWMPMAMSWFVADQSNELMLLSRIVRGDAAASDAVRRMEAQGGYDKNGTVLLALAIHKRREGDYSDALERYQRLRKMEPDRPMILNNIGNLYFLMKQYNEAVAYYKQATIKNPRDAVSHYNLSLVYREMLLFEDAEKEYNAAQKINLPLIQSFHGSGSVDEVFQKRILWKTALAASVLKDEEARRLFGKLMNPLTLNTAPLGVILFGAGAFVLRGVISRKFTATACPLCGRSICYHCQRRVLDVKTCTRCWSSFKNIKRKADLRPLKIRQQWRHRMARGLSVLFPGAGHIYIGRVTRGFIFLAVFMGLFFTLLFRTEFLQPPGEQSLIGFVGSLIIGVGLFFLYLKVFWELFGAFPSKS